MCLCGLCVISVISALIFRGYSVFTISQLPSTGGAAVGRWASHSPLPSLLLLTRGCMGLDHWIMCCSGHPGWSLMSWLSVPTVPTRWRINIVIVSPLAGSRHSVFRVKDGCCSWSPYISLTLRYSTTRAVKEIARKFRDIWRGFLLWLFRTQSQTCI